MTVFADGYELEAKEINIETEPEKSEGKGIVITSCHGQGNLSLIIPGMIEGKPVVEIGKKAFFSTNSLKEVKVPSSVRVIGDWAFSRCPILRTFSVYPIGIDKADTLVELGRGVFEGSSRMEVIDLNISEDRSEVSLAAALASRLPAPFLLRDKTIGSPEWYRKWDMALINFLNTDDYEGYSDRALCGEEDISYDGIGSVDGEVLGESAQYIKEVGKNKASLSIMRLMNGKYLEADTETALKEYIRTHSMGKSGKGAWYYVSEDVNDDTQIISFFLDIVNPDSAMVDEMIADLKAEKARTRAFLINYKTEKFGKRNLFADLML